jgi:hypothetical protein
MRLLTVLFLLLSGIASAATPEAPLSCVKIEQSFKAFLSRFTDDIAFQRSRLVLPLVSRSGDYEEGSLKVDLLSRSNIEKLKDPLIYSRAELKKLNLAQSILLLQKDRYAEVYQANAGEADDTRLLYKFRNVSGCWFLEETHDRSL